MRAPRLLERSSPSRSLGSGRGHRPIQFDPALSSTSLDGPRGWGEISPRGRRTAAGDPTGLRLLSRARPGCPRGLSSTRFRKMVIRGRRYSNRVFGLVVPALADALLPGEAGGARALRLLRAALPHRRAQQLLLSTALARAL